MGGQTILAILMLGCAFSSAGVAGSEHDPPSWQGALAPLPESAWNAGRALHLLERAGFGGTPEEVRSLTALGPAAAVRRLVYFDGVPEDAVMPPFDHSGVFDPGLDPFPPSRPATTEAAKADGQALGIQVKPAGNRPVQPVVNKFFYWLRASSLESNRVAYWWANRMLATQRPLQEKIALFWHGHFATNEDKVRDYRKMLQQVELFQARGLGNFHSLLVAVAKDPAMLAFLDAGINVKGSPNENFAREIMELFTMGPGNYTETDIREGARAFTGWNFRGTDFTFNAEHHDDGEKSFLGRTGDLDGEDVIAIIMEQEATARFVAAKLYRYFVRDDLDPALAGMLGERLSALDFEIAPFLEMLFASRDFHAGASVATRIKSPVELAISTYRKLGMTEVPGVPDFNSVTAALGQHLLHPPTVAGWSQGRSWVTPGLLFERGNFVLDLVFPDIAFVPPDRYPPYGQEILAVHERVRSGMDISAATKPVGVETGMDAMAASNLLADRDEAFNTRFGSYRGWQLAIERVKPISRHTARLDLASMVRRAELSTPREVVDYLAARFLSVPLDDRTAAGLAQLLSTELGTGDIESAATWLEEPLRILLHALLSLPEYQLG